MIAPSLIRGLREKNLKEFDDHTSENLEEMEKNFFFFSYLTFSAFLHENVVICVFTQVLTPFFYDKN